MLPPVNVVAFVIPVLELDIPLYALLYLPTLPLTALGTLDVVPCDTAIALLLPQ